MSELAELPALRPPCSAAERDTAHAIASALRGLSFNPRLEPARAPTSPTWAPRIRALLRVWAVAFLAAYRPVPAIVLAALAVLTGFPAVGALVRFVPVLGSTTLNVVAPRMGTNPDSPPLVVTAHLDAHPAAGNPMRGWHATTAAAAGWIALAAAVVGRPGVLVWKMSVVVVAVESVATIIWLARSELSTQSAPPDDNTSGLLTLMRVARLISKDRPERNTWIVGSGAGTSGSLGFMQVLREHNELREAWVVEVDALGAGEVVASPLGPRFPHPGTPAPLVRAMVAAARETGDPLTVRRVRLSHSDARAALRLRTPAITMTGGLRPPAGGQVPDPANAERAAVIIDGLARSAEPF